MQITKKKKRQRLPNTPEPLTKYEKEETISQGLNKDIITKKEDKDGWAVWTDKEKYQRKFFNIFVIKENLKNVPQILYWRLKNALIKLLFLLKMSF